MTNGFEPGLQLIHGNHVEDLADLLAVLLTRYPPAPLEPALFLVQSNGMAQWLKLRLARADAWGIAAGLDMQMPARFVWQAYRTVLGPAAVPEQSPFDKELLTWRLLRLLPEVSAGDGFEPLARFLRDDADLRKCHQLAARLADLFDQYQVYRADWLHAWAAGDDVVIDARGQATPLPDNQRWQPALWRQLLADLPPEQRDLSRATVHHRCVQRLHSDEAVVGLPRRLVVFGISSLPQQVLEALDALATRMRVLVLVHNPCQYYWGDIVEGRELLRSFTARHPGKQGLAGLEPPELLPQVNPLLASWGKLGRDYIAQLYGYDQATARSEQIDLFRSHFDEADSTLLAELQQGILELAPPSSPPRPVAPTDDSITFQLAHSRQREVEILHDRLLDLLERSHGQSETQEQRDVIVQPRDVIVMVPDIALYAPHIEAVFGNVGSDDPRHIPYTIADRPARGTDPLLIALEQLLQLPEARFAASDVLALLEVEAIRTRAGIDADALPLLRRWIQQSGIRWGLDGAHRAGFDLPAFEQNSWRFGLDRMLLGYAAGDEGAWHGIEPFAEPSGQAAALVGRIGRLLDQLDRQRRALAQPHTAEQWVTLLRALLDEFFSVEEAHQQLLLERCDEVLTQWLDACRLARLEQPLPLAVVRDMLLGEFENEGVSQRFLAGCVNFCTLMPMRAIPFPVVCLLGMNDGDYPRQRPPADFDLMAGSYRPGDRSRRDDDRYLFLEALLSARRQLYISYIGRDERDNSERTPSVLVAQLRDHLAAGWCDADGGALLERLTTVHPLQPFSPRYFDGASDSPLFTYAREWMPVPPAAQPDALLPLAAAGEAVTLDELARFLRRPADHFFSRRLSTRLAFEWSAVEDDEPFALDHLQTHQVRSALFDAARRLPCDASVEHVEAALTDAAVSLLGQGGLPPGAGGELALQNALETTRDTLNHWQHVTAYWPQAAEPLEVDLVLADGALPLQDWLGGLRTDGSRLALVECRPSQAYSGRGRLKYHYFSGLWLRYLAARACGHDLVALLVVTDGVHCLPPVSATAAREQLEQLAAAWLSGLEQPLPLALNTALRWVEAGDAASVEDPGLREAYEGSYNRTGECAEDPVLSRCWPTLRDIVAAGLPAWADRVYGPLATALDDLAELTGQAGWVENAGRLAAVRPHHDAETRETP